MPSTTASVTNIQDVSTSAHPLYQHPLTQDIPIPAWLLDSSSTSTTPPSPTNTPPAQNYSLHHFNPSINTDASKLNPFQKTQTTEEQQQHPLLARSASSTTSFDSLDEAAHGICNRNSTDSTAETHETLTNAFDLDNDNDNTLWINLIASEQSLPLSLTPVDNDVSSGVYWINRSVKRNMADFLRLHSEISKKHEALLVPPLPLLGLHGRMKYGLQYHEARRKGLEKFVNKLAQHPKLVRSDEFKRFLSKSNRSCDVSGEDEARARAAVSGDDADVKSSGDREERRQSLKVVGGAAGGGREVAAWASFKVWQMKRAIERVLEKMLDRNQSLSVAKRTIENANDELGGGVDGNYSSNSFAEQRLRRLQKYVIEVDADTKRLRNAVGKCIGSREELSRNAVQVSDALLSFAQTESGTECARVAEIVGKELMREGKGMNREKKCEFVLEEILFEIGEKGEAAKELVARRLGDQQVYEHALEVYTKLRDRVEAQTAALWSREGGTGAIQGLVELQAQLKTAAERLAESRTHYENVCSSTNAELRRFRAELHDELSKWLKNYADQSLRSCNERAKEWQRVLDSCAQSLL
uniref:PX domain-containing protein n=1 Tax=Timspurckia oligopyrenoides TaxID=708627 RepID=A0A7S0ZFQ7_9RHOD|mmetsp:Transcript_3581/g.6269  ORF Transcript_3581/g.6269 Transcript_3581/m.6269 type:complete len:584 (+) Transcript_3581:66-1817(+)